MESHKLKGYPVTDFLWTPTQNSHVLRRKVIVKEKPDILKLQGVDIKTGIISGTLFAIQMLTAYYISCKKDTLSWKRIIFTAYVLGGTITHSNFAAIHELSHDLVWGEPVLNMLQIIMLTIPMAVPLGISFRRHHLDHHVHFGVDGKDPDIPATIEGRIVQGRLTKLLSILLLPLGYLIRPAFVNPKKPNLWEAFNAVVVLFTDYLVYNYWGYKAMMYLLLSSYFALSIHPLAGHFISEHYIIYEGLPFQETFSYYGILNFFTYNFGYHNEHHDFPNVPGSKLPELKNQAAEFYDYLPATPSWPKAVIDYIMTDGVTAFSRIKRISQHGGMPSKDHSMSAKNNPTSSAYTTPFILYKEKKQI